MTRPKNILIVSKNNLDQNGVTNVVLNLSSNITHELFRFYFVVPKINDYKLKSQFDKLGISVIQHEIPFFRIVKYILYIFRFCKVNRIDIIHVHGSSRTIFFELFASWMCKVKIRIAHSHNSTAKMLLFHYLIKIPFNLLYTHALACGEKAGRWMYSNKKFQVLDNGIYLEKFAFSQKLREKIRNELGITNQKIIGHIGSFNDQKNHKFLIDVFEKTLKKNCDTYLVLVGAGDHFEAISQYVKTLNMNENVVFLGKRHDIAEIYNAFDIFVLPSKYEGFPLVLVEAQTNGLYCIVSDKVSNEVNINNNITFLSIDTDIVKWVNTILAHEYDEYQRKDVSNRTVDLMIEKGYDINRSKSKIEEIYNSDTT